MKILIAYSSAGAGHKRVAEALFSEIFSRIKDTKIIDALDYTNPLFKFIYTQGYHLLSIYLPKLWGFFFYLCENRYLSLPIDLVRFSVNRLNSARLNRFLIKEKPDIIISTHFFVNEVYSFLKKRGLIGGYLASVVTDLCAHRFWIKECVDLYIVGSEETKRELINKGVSEDKIKVLGIPVDRKFYISQDRGQLCQRLGIREDTFTVLIVTGTVGSGPIEEIVDCLQDGIHPVRYTLGKNIIAKLSNGVQIICVCGLNRRLYIRLMNKRYRFTKVYGLVENMDELMSVSDLIITKPGGSTISEALVKSLPMVFTSIIPGQEEKNAKIMEDFGVGKIPKDIKDLKRIIFYLKEDRKELERIKERMREFSKSNSTEEVLNEICKSSDFSPG